MNKITVSILSIFISSVSLASALVTSSNFSFTRNVYVVEEGLRAVVTVTPKAIDERAVITLKVEGGTAVPGSDFTLPGDQGTFTIPFEKGDTLGKSFSVQLKTDSVAESNETLNVSIVKINGVSLVTPISTIISVKDKVQGSAPKQNTGALDGTGIRVEIDKLNAVQNEMFKVTVSGLPSRYFTTGGLLRFSRVGAPSTSCENASRSDLCQVAVGISCGILPKYMGVSPAQWYADAAGRIEYVCYANGENNNRNGAINVNSADQTYVVKAIAPAPVPYTNGGVTPPMVSVNTASILMRASGNTASRMTSYNACSEGKGINPFEIYKGCIDCEYLPTGWRDNISTCQNMNVVVYKWNERTKRSSIFELYGQCSGPKSGVCTQGVDRTCEISDGNRNNTNARIFSCTPNGQESYSVPKGLYGYVKDVNGQPLVGVKVTVPWVGLGISWTTVTDADGKYVISNVEPAGVSHLSFSKTGYLADGMLAKLGENETFILRPTPRAGELEVCPINIFRSTLANNPCNCPAGTTKENATGGFTCVTGTSATANSPLSITPSVGTFDPTTGNTLVFTISNASANDLEACYDRLGSSVGTGYCADTNNYFNFGAGNADWKWEGDKFVGRFTYNAGTWGNGGIKTVSYFRKKSDPSTIITATIQVKQTPQQANSINPTIDQGGAGTSGSYGGGASAVPNDYGFGSLMDVISNGIGGLMGAGGREPSPTPDRGAPVYDQSTSYTPGAVSPDTSNGGPGIGYPDARSESGMGGAPVFDQSSQSSGSGGSRSLLDWLVDLF